MITEEKKKTYTGGLLPRDYGIEIPLLRGQRPLLASPARYALGAMLLQNPTSLRALISSYANEHDLPVREFTAKVREGWTKRFGSDPFADENGLVGKMESYRNMVFSNVASRSDPDTVHGADLEIVRSVSGLLFYSGDCGDCKDFRYAKPKGFNLRCAHLAATELALAEDVAKRASTGRSRSGLAPRKRSETTVPIPLKPEEAFPLALEYLVNKQLYWKISQEAFKERILDENVEALFLQGGAQFSVMLHGGQFRRPHTLSTTEQRHYGATSEVRKDIRRWLKGNQFRRQGYSLAFQGTAGQRVAERWRESDTVYEIVTVNKLPIMMRKTLDHLHGRWHESVASPEGSVLGAQRYRSIDDATRRECEVSVYLPQELGAAQPAQNLRRPYEKLLGLNVSETR